VAENERAFRRANEQIRRLASSFGEDEPLPALCECGNARCTRTLALTLDEYTAIRAQPDTFVVLPGHTVHHLEDVVEEHERYTVVSKQNLLKDLGRPE
jgi:hypothetical protein